VAVKSSEIRNRSASRKFWNRHGQWRRQSFPFGHYSDSCLCWAIPQMPMNGHKNKKHVIRQKGPVQQSASDGESLLSLRF
jgi:hypothetical protein